MSSITATAGSPARWAVLGVCVLGTVLVYIHRLGFAPLVPTFVTELGLTYGAAGTLMASYFWTYIAVQLPMGAITDRFGARRTMLGSLALLGVGVVAFVLSRGYADSLLARALVGLGSAGFWLPSLRLIQEWFPAHERGRATGICSAGGGIGGTAALLLLPVLVEPLGWRWAYAATLLPWLAMVALTAWLVRAGPLATPASPAGGEGPVGGLTRAARAPGVAGLCVAAFTSYAAFVGLITWLPAFLVRQEGMSPSQAGLVTSLVTAGTMLSWPFAGVLSDRLGRRKPIYLVSQALGAAGCLALAWLVPGAGLGASLAAAGFIGLALGGMVLPIVMLIDFVPPRLVGIGSGLLNSCWLLGGLVAPGALGRLIDATGSFAAAFVGCAILAALALGAVALVTEPVAASRPGRG